jgi:spore germination protein GerM
VPTDARPVQIDVSTSPTRSHPVGSSAVTSVFFVHKGRLVPVERRIDSAHPVTQAVEALLNGVTDQEAADGLRSALGNGVTLHGVSRHGDDHVSVDLGDAFATVGGSEQALAVGQVVFTVTQVDGGLPVQISLDGAPVQVPRPDGTLTGRPLTRTDYRSLASG